MTTTVPDKASGATLTATPNAAWKQPWTLGDWSQLALSPFDETSLLTEQQSHVHVCDAPMGTLGSQQAEDTKVPCTDCPQGYEFGPTALRCRPVPDCPTAQACSVCQIQATQPQNTGPCSMCVSYGCDVNSNRCSCA